MIRDFQGESDVCVLSGNTDRRLLVGTSRVQAHVNIRVLFKGLPIKELPNT